MNQELIIKNIMGDLLQAEGFTYVEASDSSIRFIRKISNLKNEKITQMVEFQSGQFQNEIFMNLRSSAAGHLLYQMNKYVPDCNEHSLLFSNNKEYIQAIKKYARIFQEYGIPFLQKIAEPLMTDYLTNEDYEDFYQRQELILKEYLEQAQISIFQYTVEQAAEFVEQEMANLKGTEFQQVKNRILELSAFWAAVISQIHTCEWILTELGVSTICQLHFPETKSDTKEIPIITWLYREWLGTGEKSGLKRALLDKYEEATLPFSKMESLLKLQQENQRKKQEKYLVNTWPEIKVQQLFSKSADNVTGSISFPDDSLFGMMDLTIENFNGDVTISSMMISNNNTSFIIEDIHIREMVPLEDSELKIALVNEKGSTFAFYRYQRDGVSKHSTEIPVNNGIGRTYLNITGACKKISFYCEIDIFELCRYF